MQKPLCSFPEKLGRSRNRLGMLVHQQRLERSVAERETALESGLGNFLEGTRSRESLEWKCKGGRKSQVNNCLRTMGIGKDFLWVRLGGVAKASSGFTNN